MTRRESDDLNLCHADRVDDEFQSLSIEIVEIV